MHKELHAIEGNEKKINEASLNDFWEKMMHLHPNEPNPIKSILNSIEILKKLYTTLTVTLSAIPDHLNGKLNIRASCIGHVVVYVNVVGYSTEKIVQRIMTNVLRDGYGRLPNELHDDIHKKGFQKLTTCAKVLVAADPISKSFMKQLQIYAKKFRGVHPNSPEMNQVNSLRVQMDKITALSAYLSDVNVPRKPTNDEEKDLANLRENFKKLKLNDEKDFVEWENKASGQVM